MLPLIALILFGVAVIAAAAGALLRLPQATKASEARTAHAGPAEGEVYEKLYGRRSGTAQENVGVPSTFGVAFDGGWQRDFDTLAEAVEWAQEVSASGPTTWVVERRIGGLSSSQLRATFPEEGHESAERPWRAAEATSWKGPSQAGG